MRVLIVNTWERSGGAAVAANRLMTALNNNGVKVRMLVRDKVTDELMVSALPDRWRCRWHFLWERFVIWLHLHLHQKHLFEIDTASCGTDITQLAEFQEADIIHLHWVYQGMLSLKDIRKIFESGKPVVWTMHDMWPATAICHLTLGCRKFEDVCSQCRLLPANTGITGDLAARVWQRKQRMLQGHKVSFVACSQWLASEAAKSTLLKDMSVCNIPNPIDTKRYHPGDQQAARRQLGLPTSARIILFASQRVTNVNKGMEYLINACHLLLQQHSECTADNICVAILGGHAEEIADRLPFPAYPLGYVNDEQRIVSVYQAADVFVLPSLSENLPNTIMEAMACGIPSVGFHIGGIPEMIDHLENGYVAAYRDAADLSAGLWWTLYEADRAAVSHSCVQKVAHSYSQQSVAMRYIEEYQKLIHTRKK